MTPLAWFLAGAGAMFAAFVGAALLFAWWIERTVPLEPIRPWRDESEQPCAIEVIDATNSTRTVGRWAS